MVGAYHITVSNRFLKYEFTIRRNITVVKGNRKTLRCSVRKKLEGAAGTAVWMYCIY